MSQPHIPEKFLNWERNRRRAKAEKFKHTINIEWFRRFTLKERIQIALGANFLVRAVICTRKVNDVVKPIIVGDITKYLTATDHMRKGLTEEMANHLDEDGMKQFADSQEDSAQTK